MVITITANSKIVKAKYNKNDNSYAFTVPKRLWQTKKPADYYECILDKETGIIMYKPIEMTANDR